MNIVNVQGDEPLIHEDHLKKLIHCFQDPNTNSATVVPQLSNIKNSTKWKSILVKDRNEYALIFLEISYHLLEITTKKI